METSEILLGASILLPPIGWAVLIAPYLKKQRPLDSWRNVLFMLNPEHGLGSQTLFWLVVLAPLTYFVIFGAFAWKGYDVSLNADGFKQFIDISTLPIALLSLSIPLTALVTYLHSTAQTAKQIEKNEHELFYLHRREFIFYFEQIGATTLYDVFKVEFRISPRIHGQFFKGEVKEGIPLLDTCKVDELVGKFKEAERCLAQVLTEPHSDETHQAYFTFCENVNRLINFLAIRDLKLHVETNSYLMSWPGAEGREVQSIGWRADHAIAAFDCLRVYLNNILHFSTYKKGLQDLYKDDRSVVKLCLSEGADDKIKRIVATYSPNAPAWLYG